MPPKWEPKIEETSTKNHIWAARGVSGRTLPSQWAPGGGSPLKKDHKNDPNLQKHSKKRDHFPLFF